MPELDCPSTFTPRQQDDLLRLARDAIERGLRHGTCVPVDHADDPELAQPSGAFVTLYVAGELHGCIGSIEPVRPLAAEVARCAYAAAFEDPRFPPLRPEELDELDIRISVLHPPRTMVVADEADLLRQLRPGVDGLVLEDPPTGRRSTFLPAVWEKLADPHEFVTQLKLKARLRADEWPTTLRWSRYTAESIPAAAPS